MKKLNPFSGKKLINAIIETPKASGSKFDYEPETDCFELSEFLPLGRILSMDFGFIPGTKGEDGDPLR